MPDQPLRVLVCAGGGLGHVSGGVGTLMGYMLAAWAMQPDGPLVQVIDTRGQGGRVAGVGRFAWAAGVLAWRCATGQVDVVHLHMTTRGSVLRKGLLCGLAAACATPCIVHMHGADFLAFHARMPRALQRMANRALRRAARVVVLGEAWRDSLVREAGLDPARVEVLRNGVPMPAPRPPRAPGPPRILFLGRIGARKGVPELLAALATPALAGRAWQATIAGDGAVARFAAEARALGLDDRVTLPGWLGGADAAALLAQADMLVLPSHHEALPMAVIEALAHGVAVITTPVGAVPEFLCDGTDALLVPPGDVPALAAALARLLDDPAQRALLAGAGHERYRRSFEVAATAEHMLAIYRAAAAGRPAAAARPTVGGAQPRPAGI